MATGLKETRLTPLLAIGKFSYSKIIRKTIEKQFLEKNSFYDELGGCYRAEF